MSKPRRRQKRIFLDAHPLLRLVVTAAGADKLPSVNRAGPWPISGAFGPLPGTAGEVAPRGVAGGIARAREAKSDLPVDFATNPAAQRQYRLLVGLSGGRDRSREEPPCFAYVVRIVWSTRPPQP